MSNQYNKSVSIETRKRLEIILHRINDYFNEDQKYMFGGPNTDGTPGYNIFAIDMNNPKNHYHYYFEEDIFNRYSKLTDDDIRAIQNCRELLT